MIEEKMISKRGISQVTSIYIVYTPPFTSKPNIEDESWRGESIRVITQPLITPFQFERRIAKGHHSRVTRVKEEKRFRFSLKPREAKKN